jgi:hypothetical protein
LSRPTFATLHIPRGSKGASYTHTRHTHTHVDLSPCRPYSTQDVAARGEHEHALPLPPLAFPSHASAAACRCRHARLLLFVPLPPSSRAIRMSHSQCLIPSGGPSWGRQLLPFTRKCAASPRDRARLLLTTRRPLCSGSVRALSSSLHTRTHTRRLCAYALGAVRALGGWPWVGGSRRSAWRRACWWRRGRAAPCTRRRATPRRARSSRGCRTSRAPSP